jgi:hypothetical protein
MQNEKLLITEAGGTYNYRWVLKGEINLVAVDRGTLNTPHCIISKKF